MTKVAVSLKIDVSKIDKARLFSGAKGTYLDATIFVDLDNLDQYGNSGMITQDVSKEEKAQGIKGNILGNGKVFWKEGGQAPQAQGQGFQQQAPQQQQQQQQQQPARDSQGFTAAQGGFKQQQQQQQQQQAPVNTNGSVDFDSDLPF
jgi:hypothetical protein